MMYGFGWMWMLLGLFVTVALAVWLVRVMFPQGKTDTQPRDDALDIARRRYARGEIGRDELESIRQELTRR